MISIRSSLFAIVGVNLIAVALLTINVHSHRSSSDKLVNLPAFIDNVNGFLSSEPNTNPIYRFTNPKAANYILSQLDVFETIERVPDADYKVLAGGFKINNKYCQHHRTYFVEHPELVFAEKNIITNFWRTHKFRTEVMPAIGAIDLHPTIFINKKNVTTFDTPMRVDANVFFTTNFLYMERKLGKQFSCLSQVSNHIPGHDKMYRKDNVGQSLVDYAKTYATRPECFNFKKHFPKTWVLQKKDQCRDFFKEFNGPQYRKLKAERRIVYFRKIGAFVHKGEGVFPVGDKQEAYIRKLYKNGAHCGKIKDNNLIQYSIYNPLLLENRKFHFRSLMLIASTNPMLAYYHDGYLRLSLNEYDAKSKEVKTFVTNIGVNLKKAKKGSDLDQMTTEEIEEKTSWFLEDFQRYCLEQNIIQDPNYLENTLRPEFKKVMVHLIRMTQSALVKKSSVFELYGLDFLMDKNLNLWFIEANARPLINGFTPESTKLLNRVLIDSLEIVLGLLKSRMKRAIAYVNLLTQELHGDGLYIPDLQAKREYFRTITQNYFEPEFEPSAGNTFQKIVDDREHGVKRYNGFLAEKCL